MDYSFMPRNIKLYIVIATYLAIHNIELVVRSKLNINKNDFVYV